MTKTPAQLADVKRTLAEGGFVRFTWGVGTVELIDSRSHSRRLDRRTYQAITKRSDLQRTTTGSVESKDLIVEWRQPEADFDMRKKVCELYGSGFSQSAIAAHLKIPLRQVIEHLRAVDIKKRKS